MNNEHQLNAYLTLAIKGLGNYMYLKTSEKYMAGVSDFLVWHKGMGLALEVKLCKGKKTDRQKLLGHPFSSRQLSFLHGFNYIGGGHAFGLVGVADEKRLYPVKWDVMPSSGNWQYGEFMEKHKLYFGYKEIDKLMEYMFYGDIV